MYTIPQILAAAKEAEVSEIDAQPSSYFIAWKL